MTDDIRRIPILSGSEANHFLTITEKGLEILGNPSGERTVVSDLDTLRSLYSELESFVDRNSCKSWIFPPEIGESTHMLPCLLRRDHTDLHFSRYYTHGGTAVAGVVFWSDDSHAPEFHTA